MQITIRKYRKTDFNALVKIMEDFQDYIVSIDDLKRSRRLPNHGRIYCLDLLNKVKKNKGFLFLAEDNNKIIGMIAGIIQKQDKLDLLQCIPTKTGRVLELFVSAGNRSRGIGALLMEKAENYFKKNKCDVIKVDVFSPNTMAYKFYRRLGYSDRMVDMIKLLL